MSPPPSAAAPAPTPIGHGPVLHRDGTVTFRVWAPAAERCDLLLDDARHALQPRHDVADAGWYTLRTAAGAGARYAFSLDGGPERPDPAGRRQPDGVHSRSALVDTAAWSWSDDDFRPARLPAAALYELHIPTFTPGGTFDSAQERLPALRDLGITHVEVMPVNAYNGDRGWGYDGVAWYAVQEGYGGPEGFAAFVDACHALDLAVVLDVVYNHLGPSGNYLGEFGPYLTDRYTTPWGDAPNVDGPHADPVRRFVLDNVRMWLAEYHVDGLRLDAVHGIVDTSSVHLLTEMATLVSELSDATGRDLQLIAETDRQDPQTVRPRVVGGHGLDGQWLDDLHHSLHTALTGEHDGYYVDYDGLTDVARVYGRGMAYDGRWSAYRSRTVGTAVPPDVSSRRFVTCIQNHDQVGNRARGERLSTLVEPALLRAGIALLCLSPTTPMLFMGDEFAATTPFLFFSGHPEPELDEAVREGRRAEFASFASFEGEVPDPQDPATMEASRLDWSQAATGEGAARWRLWQDLLAMRRSEPALATGDRSRTTVLSASTDAMVVHRAGPPDVVIMANLSPEARHAEVPAGWADVARAVVPRWSSAAARYGGPGTTPTADAAGLLVPPTTVALYGSG